jgi:hypothetical protein
VCVCGVSVSPHCTRAYLFSRRKSYLPSIVFWTFGYGCIVKKKVNKH